MVRIAATLVLAIGGVLIIQGQLTVGEYVQFVVYLGLLSNAANQISRALERLQQGSAAAGRIGEVLLRRPKIADRPAAIAPHIEGHLHFENVGVKYASRKRTPGSERALSACSQRWSMPGAPSSWKGSVVPRPSESAVASK